MPVAGNTLYSMDVWLDDKGKLHTGTAQHRHKDVCSELNDVVYMLDVEKPNTKVNIILYANNLTELRKAFEGEE